MGIAGEGKTHLQAREKLIGRNRSFKVRTRTAEGKRFSPSGL